MDSGRELVLITPSERDATEMAEFSADGGELFRQQPQHKMCVTEELGGMGDHVTSQVNCGLAGL